MRDRVARSNRSARCLSIALSNNATKNKQCWNMLKHIERLSIFTLLGAMSTRTRTWRKTEHDGNPFCIQWIIALQYIRPCANLNSNVWALCENANPQISGMLVARKNHLRQQSRSFPAKSCVFKTLRAGQKPSCKRGRQDWRVQSKKL